MYPRLDAKFFVINDSNFLPVIDQEVLAVGGEFDVALPKLVIFVQLIRKKNLEVQILHVL